MTSTAAVTYTSSRGCRKDGTSCVTFGSLVQYQQCGSLLCSVCVAQHEGRGSAVCVANPTYAKCTARPQVASCQTASDQQADTPIPLCSCAQDLQSLVQLPRSVQTCGHVLPALPTLLCKVRPPGRYMLSLMLSTCSRVLSDMFEMKVCKSLSTLLCFGQLNSCRVLCSVLTCCCVFLQVVSLSL